MYNFNQIDKFFAISREIVVVNLTILRIHVSISRNEEIIGELVLL